MGGSAALLRRLKALLRKGRDLSVEKRASSCTATQFHGPVSHGSMSSFEHPTNAAGLIEAKTHGVRRIIGDPPANASSVAKVAARKQNISIGNIGPSEIGVAGAVVRPAQRGSELPGPCAPRERNGRMKACAGHKVPVYPALRRSNHVSLSFSHGSDRSTSRNA